MAAVVGSKTETRKQWVAPELKKVNIEQITAFNGGGRLDLLGQHRLTS